LQQEFNRVTLFIVVHCDDGSAGSSSMLATLPRSREAFAIDEGNG
jgi:hypothetical protein